MNEEQHETITLEMMRAHLYGAVFSDILDDLGHRDQVVGVELRPLGGDGVLIGRAKTTLWARVNGKETNPYELELRAVDECRDGDIFVAAAGGDPISGVWGELLSTAASARGSAGAIIDGGVRDVAKIRAMDYPVFARSTCVRDSKNRQTVVEIDAAVEVGSVSIRTGDLIVADVDGVVVVPRDIEEKVVRAAWTKAHEESRVRDAIRDGMSATEAYRRFGVL